MTGLTVEGGLNHLPVDGSSVTIAADWVRQHHERLAVHLGTRHQQGRAIVVVVTVEGLSRGEVGSGTGYRAKKKKKKKGGSVKRAYIIDGGYRARHNTS